LTLNLAIEPGTTAITDPFTRSYPAPFRPTRIVSPFVEGKSRRIALSHVGSDRLAAHLVDMRKMRLTDFCNQYNDTSTRESPDSRAPQCALRWPPPRGPPRREPQSPSERGARPPRGDPTPGRETLDGGPPASAASLASLLLLKRRRDPPDGGAAPLRRIQPRKGPAKRPLTLSVAPRSPARRTGRAARRARTASTAPTSMWAASPDQSAFHRQVLLMRPLSRTGARHRSRGFATA